MAGFPRNILRLGELQGVLKRGEPLTSAGGVYTLGKKYSYTGPKGKSISEEEFRKNVFKQFNPDVKETYWDKEKNLIKAGVDPKLVKEKEKKTVKKKMTKKTKTPLTKQKVLMARQVGSGQTIKKTLMG